jgi:nucleoside-diphosphate-sugar epimerase
MKVAVFGGSGRIGRHVVAELVNHGYSVVNADRKAPPHVDWLYNQSGAEIFTMTDTTVLGDVVAVMKGADAVINLAAIPNPIGHLPEHLFSVNMSSDYNVLEAAEMIGIKKIAMASSVNAIGAAFNRSVVPPEYFPIDEKHKTRCEEVYSVTKWLGEELAAACARRRDVQIASLRFTWVADKAVRTRIAACQDSYRTNEHGAKSFWCWVDIRDVAVSCRLAIEGEWGGHEVFWINAADTYLNAPSTAAIAHWYPDVDIRQPIEGNSALITSAKVERLLGWRPEYAWHV